jgi:hypothetical protein
VVAGVVLTACAGEGPARDADADASADRSVSVTQAEASPEEDVISAVDDPGAEGLPEPLVDVDRLVSGGPPPDGIPSIDEPRFDRAADVDFLEPEEPVLAVEVDGEARAYPVQIVIWHEIVNDTVAGVPVAVTYCPLCNSALAFDRRVADRVVSFGVSGLLYNSDLVMFDRQTRSLWPQLEGTAVAGVLTGTELERVPVQTVPWREWSREHPRDLVLNRDTGYERDYGQNPYVGYDEVGTDPFLLDVDADDRLPAKERVVGLGRGEDAVAVTTDRLLEEGTHDLEVGGEVVVLLARGGQASALDRANVADGRDVGVTGAFSPVVDDRRLTFTRRGATFVDDPTGSTWSVLGQATKGPLKGSRLTPVEHVDTFWFSWAAFQPETAIIR